MSATDLRLALQANGYSPVPCVGKRPSISGWQHKINASADEMRMWSGANTGMLTALTPGIDITDPEAAELAELVAKELFGDRGKILVRFGRLPKRTLPFRTSTPFPKMSASFEAPNGTSHKIEILGDGQQFICFGTHPDTGEPFTWHGGTPLDTPREELGEITEEDVQAYLELVSERLVEECGFKRVFTNGHGAEHEAGPVDVWVNSDIGTVMEWSAGCQLGTSDTACGGS
jgi:Bifunctional DNA primase/polymerase, N-terminal